MRIAKQALVLATLAVLPAFVLGGCGHLMTTTKEISLNGYAEENYLALNNSIRKSTCIVGKLNIDSLGVYFPLQPIDDGEVISLGFSRINTGLTAEYAKQNDMQNEKVYRICGMLRDDTPFRKCDSNFCRWYKLENARLGSR